MVDMSKGMGSSGDNDWMTPKWLFELVQKEFCGDADPFDLDPAGKEGSPATVGCLDSYFLPKNDGLKLRWVGKVFLNPPYGRGIGSWLEKAYTECDIGNADFVVCLLAARTETEWWHEWCMRAHEICFLDGRVAFDHDTKSGSSPAFPSVLVIFRRGSRKWGQPLLSTIRVRDVQRRRVGKKIRLKSRCVNV